MASRLIVVTAVLALASCLSDGRPLSEYEVDLGLVPDARILDDGGVVGPPDAIGCSGEAGELVIVAVENDSGDSVAALFVDEACVESLVDGIGIGATSQIRMRFNRVYRFRAETTQEILLELRADASTPTMITLE